MDKDVKVRRKAEDEHKFLADVQALESRAHDLGFTLTGQALNRAKNVTGWLMAGDESAAIQAMSGKHPT